MKKLCQALWFLFFVVTLFAAAAYWLQKRGLVRITVNYNDQQGNTVSRELDEAVESTVGALGEKATVVAAHVKAKIEQKLGVSE